MNIDKKQLVSIVENIIENYIVESFVNEKAPPGSEDKVMKLKKSLRSQHPNWKDDKIAAVAIATAWKQHNKKNKNKKEKVDEQMGMNMPQQTTSGAKPPPPVPAQAKVAGLSGAFGQANQNAEKAKQAFFKNPQDPKAKKAYIDSLDKLKALAVLEENSKERVQVTFSELKNMIRTSLAEAFGLNTDKGPTGGFDITSMAQNGKNDKKDGKQTKSGTFGDGSKTQLKEKIETSTKEIKEGILIALKEMINDDYLLEKDTHEISNNRLNTKKKIQNPIKIQESIWGYEIVDIKTGANVLIKENIEYPSLARSIGWNGYLITEAEQFIKNNTNVVFEDPGYFKRK